MTINIYSKAWSPEIDDVCARVQLIEIGGFSSIIAFVDRRGNVGYDLEIDGWFQDLDYWW